MPEKLDGVDRFDILPADDEPIPYRLTRKAAPHWLDEAEIRAEIRTGLVREAAISAAWTVAAFGLIYLFIWIATAPR